MADTQGPELGRLPNWDLGDLYPGRDSAELKGDLARIGKEAPAFRDAYRGKLAGLDGAAFGAAIAAYEAMQETTGRVMSYAQLVYSGDMTDAEIGRFFQTMQERVTDDLHRPGLLHAGDQPNWTMRCWRHEAGRPGRPPSTRPGCATCGPIARISSPTNGALLHEKYVVGRAAWTRLFDETMARLRFPVDGKDADQRRDPATSCPTTTAPCARRRRNRSARCWARTRGSSL